MSYGYKKKRYIQLNINVQTYKYFQDFGDMLPVLPSNLRVFKVIKCCNLYFMVNYPVILRTIGCKANYLNYYTTLQSIKLNGASTIIMIYQLLLIHGGKKKIVDIS